METFTGENEKPAWGMGSGYESLTEEQTLDLEQILGPTLLK